jgi:hypothetical protein
VNSKGIGNQNHYEAQEESKKEILAVSNGNQHYCKDRPDVDKQVKVTILSDPHFAEEPRRKEIPL